MTLSYTRRFKLAVPDFQTEPWHAEFAQAMDSIDAALFTAMVGQDVAIWENSHDYLIGDLVLDPLSGTLYACAENHTSSALPITFESELTLFPSRWTSFAVNAATQAEAIAGVENTKYMTALRVAEAIVAQSPTPGIASQSQAEEGANNTEIMTPLRVRENIDARIATQADAELGTDNFRIMTPLRVAQAIDAIGLPGGEQIAFSAHKNSVNQTVTGGGPVKLTFDTEFYDLGSFFDVANSRWTPPAGQVHLDACISVISGLTGGSPLILMVFKNGSVFKESRIIVPTGSTSEGIQISVDDVGTSTDYYELYISLNTAGTAVIGGAPSQTWYQGFFLGESSAVTLGVQETGFRARKAVAQGFGAGVWQKMNYGTEEYDQGGYYDVALSRWMPPTGMVAVSASAYIVANGTQYHIGIYKNGILLCASAARTPTNEGTDHVYMEDLANGSDYYEAFINISTGGTISPSVYTFFEGHRIGIGPKGDTGAAGAAGPPGVSGTIVGQAPYPPQGRLSVLTGTPVVTTTVIGSTILCYTPHIGSRVPTYDGTSYAMTDFNEIVVPLNDTTNNPFAIAPGKVNDWFFWLKAGVPTLSHGPNWDSDTVRPVGLALTRVKGILLNQEQIGNGTTTGPAPLRGTYVGTTRTHPTQSLINWIFGTLGSGNPADHGVWNMYNRIDVAGQVNNGGGNAQVPPGIRIWGGNVNNSAKAIFGLAEDPPEVSMLNVLLGPYGGAGGWLTIGVGLNSTTVMSGVFGGVHVYTALQYCTAFAIASPGSVLGYNVWNALERNAGPDALNVAYSGIVAPSLNPGMTYRFKM